MTSKYRVDEMLQEIRIVLPGTQALLGFQFIAFFNTGFTNLPPGLQQYHLVNLLCTTVCAILLITPVAYHEIRSNGRNTEKWLRFTFTMLPLAMLALLLGLAGDAYVAASTLAIPTIVAALAGCLTALFGGVMWFGLMFLKKT